MAPRKKTTPAVDTEVKTETAVVEAVAETEKKAPAKKKTTTKAAAKTDTAKKTTTTRAKKAPATKAEVFIEYGGVQVSVDDIISNAKKMVGEDKDVKIYVQPETSKAYIAFGDESVAMDVFFCK